MAMPNLTNTKGHWACPVPESCCQEGSVLEFWVSLRGRLHYMANNDRKRKLPIEVDLSQPLWAMIDVYGQTCSIFLLVFSCVVCMVREAEITLPCGHRCLCVRCFARVLVQFGSCPLCRVEIKNISDGEGDSLGAGLSLNLSPEASDANC